LIRYVLFSASVRKCCARADLNEKLFLLVVEVRFHLLRVLAAPGERRKGAEDKGKKRNFAGFLRESAIFSRGGGSIPLELRLVS